MKICMITPDSQMIDRRIILEASSLVEEGHEVTLLAGFECKKEETFIETGILVKRYVYDWDDERLKSIRSKLPNNDKLKMTVNKIFMLMAKKLFYLNPFEMFMAKRLIEEEADVIHVHDLPCLKVGAYVSKKKNIPLIYDAHELYYSQDVLSKKQQKFYFNLEKKYILRCKEVITVNQFIAKLMEQRYSIKMPHVIMNCTNESLELESYKSNNIIRKKYDLDNNKKIVLYQGWISPERNIDSLVKSIKYTSENIVLVLVGYGEYQKKLEELCREYKIEERVIFVGEVPNEKIIEYTAAADLGVIPYEPIDENHLYCSPNKLFEYVVGELPFICNELPFLEYIREKYNILITTKMNNENEIAKTIEGALENESTLNLLRNNCKEAKKVLNWREESKKLISIYKNIEN